MRIISFFKLATAISLFFSLNGVVMSQNNGCNIVNSSFGAGEKLEFVITYNWLIPWAKVGVATFDVAEVSKNSNKLYHLSAKGNTNDSWDWFYKVNDTYQSFVDPLTLKPDSFKRDVNDDGFIIDEAYKFDKSKKTILVQHSKRKEPYKLDTVAYNNCTFDIISIFYYARNIDYANIKPGEKINVTVFMDNKPYNIYFRFIGKENMKDKNGDKYKCLKFGIYLVAGTLFNEGESMFIWVTDDRNKMPIRIDSPIKVGAVRAYLTSYKGLKHPLSSKL